MRNRLPFAGDDLMMDHACAERGARITARELEAIARARQQSRQLKAFFHAIPNDNTIRIPWSAVAPHVRPEVAHV